MGFVGLNDYVGFSPDGLVGDEGGIEIKCLLAKAHMFVIDNPTVFDKGFWAQIQFSLAISGREWWDLVHFNPSFKKNRLIIRRILPDPATIERFLLCASYYEQEIKRLVKLDEI